MSLNRSHLCKALSHVPHSVALGLRRTGGRDKALSSDRPVVESGNVRLCEDIESRDLCLKGDLLGHQQCCWLGDKCSTLGSKEITLTSLPEGWEQHKPLVGCTEPAAGWAPLPACTRFCSTADLANLTGIAFSEGCEACLPEDPCEACSIVCDRSQGFIWVCLGVSGASGHVSSCLGLSGHARLSLLQA